MDRGSQEHSFQQTKNRVAISGLRSRTFGCGGLGFAEAHADDINARSADARQLAKKDVVRSFEIVDEGTRVLGLVRLARSRCLVRRLPV
jgi:hypothetical protein